MEVFTEDIKISVAKKLRHRRLVVVVAASEFSSKLRRLSIFAMAFDVVLQREGVEVFVRRTSHS